MDTRFRAVDPSCICHRSTSEVAATSETYRASLAAAGVFSGPDPAQEAALSDLCARYGVTYDPDHYKPQFDLPKGYVAGWVGGPDARKLYVGCSPEGAVSS